MLRSRLLTVITLFMLKWLSNVRKKSELSPQIISEDQHHITNKHISNGALKVIRTLNDHNYEAYLVGGGVRDLLLGEHPKDFDIATNATPEQVKQLFRSARIIGRRFRIVHVRFGREILEVTTFRGTHNAKVQARGKRPANAKSAANEDGMLLRDNVYGTMEEDAIRRDFTINALYFNTINGELIDYTNGLADLDQQIIRIIGDPASRYQEDPVRMLRAARFAGKLGFSIEKSTAEPIHELAENLQAIPAARLFEEVLKLFMSGYALKAYQQLRAFPLFEQLFPQTAEFLDQPQYQLLIEQGLINTDKRIQAGKTVTPAFLFAVLLWPAVDRRQRQLADHEGVPALAAMHQASHEITLSQQQQTAIPKRFSIPMREIWDMQLRFNNRRGKKAQNLLHNRRFRAAYDFLLLREQAGEDTGGLGQWWTDYQQDPNNQAPKKTEHRPRKPRPRKRPAS